MTARKGTRRAAVLLALSDTPRSVSGLTRELDLKYSAVMGVLESPSMTTLVEQTPDGWKLASGPHVAEALAAARATVQATEQDESESGTDAGHSAVSDGERHTASLRASSRVTRGPDR